MISREIRGFVAQTWIIFIASKDPIKLVAISESANIFLVCISSKRHDFGKRRSNEIGNNAL